MHKGVIIFSMGVAFKECSNQKGLCFDLAVYNSKTAFILRSIQSVPSDRFVAPTPNVVVVVDTV